MNKDNDSGEVTFTVHNCDIMDGFKSIPNDSIDLIVTSPPYNVNIDYDSWDDALPKDEYFQWVESWLKECYRVLKDDGRIAINILMEANMKQCSERVFVPSEYWNIMKLVGFHWFGLIHLEELSSQRPKLTAWGSWLSPSSPYIYNPDECVLLCYKNVSKKINQGQTDLTKEEFIEYTGARWKYKPETKGLTKANFSLDIPTKAIKILTYKGETVLDPFTGSGTTGVAAIQTDRKFIGFEISPKYHAIAVDRIQHEADKKNCALQDMFGE